MGEVTRVVRFYEQYIAFDRGIKEKALWQRILFARLRSFYRQMLGKGWIILSYKWLNMDDIESFLPDENWHVCRILAQVLFVGKRRARDASFRHLLRRGHSANIIIYRALK